MFFKKLSNHIVLALIAVVLSACSKGPFEPGDRIWVDLKSVAGGNDGYIVGIYQGLEEEKVRIQVNEVVGAEEVSLAIQARDMMGSSLLVPFEQSRLFEEGNKDWKDRKMLEGTILGSLRNADWRQNLAEDVKRLSADPSASGSQIQEVLAYLDSMAKLYATKQAGMSLRERIQLNNSVYRIALQELEKDGFGRSYDLMADVFLKYYLKQHRILMKMQGVAKDLEYLQILNASPEDIKAAQDEYQKAHSRYVGQLGLIKEELDQGILEGDIGLGFSLHDRALAFVTISNIFEVNEDSYFQAIYQVLGDPQADSEEKISLLMALVTQADLLTDILTKKGAVALAAGKGKPELMITTMEPVLVPIKRQVERQLDLQTMKSEADVEQRFQKAVEMTAEYSSRLGVQVYTEADKQRFLNMLSLFSMGLTY